MCKLQSFRAILYIPTTRKLRKLLLYTIYNKIYKYIRVSHIYNGKILYFMKLIWFSIFFGSLLLSEDQPLTKWQETALYF